MDAQKGKVAGLLESQEERNTLASQNIIIENELKSKSFDEFASLKHTLGTPRQNILSYTNVLISHLGYNKTPAFMEANEAFSKEWGQSLLSVFNAIKHDINFISELLENGEKGLTLTNYLIERVSINEIQSMINRYKKNSYKFNITVSKVEDNNIKQLGIELNKTLLKVVIDNILTNADKHGFDSKLPENNLIIDLKIIDNIFTIDIKNNGKPFPKNFTKDKFIAKFSTAGTTIGTGLGGYDIDRIINHFSADWDLILNEDLFPVRFIFEFPLISL
jgi:type I restriction enzyme M protein